MGTYRLTGELIQQFQRNLWEEERSPGTVEKYLRDLENFRTWLDKRPINREAGTAWKSSLLARGLSPATVNTMITALNTFFRFAGWEELRVKSLRLQRQPFRKEERELSRQEYRRLLEAAQKSGRTRLLLLMEAICSTGIRVSEVQYLTVEAASQGRAEIFLKGKVRTILLPTKLCRKLLRYARAQRIFSGQIFRTRRGNAIGRKQIWAEMKALCQQARVAPTKVFPHNLRHLFARCFYQECRDLAGLADVLGHSSVETTRIYLATTAHAHARLLEQLQLIP